MVSTNATMAAHCETVQNAGDGATGSGVGIGAEPRGDGVQCKAISDVWSLDVFVIQINGKGNNSKSLLNHDVGYIGDFVYGGPTRWSTATYMPVHILVVR